MTDEITLKLLVVDDEAGMRMGIRRSLRGFQTVTDDTGMIVKLSVDEAESGEKAIEVIESSPPDIILLDHRMGGITGIDVLNWMEENSPEVIAIMITAYASLENAISATKKGAFDFLPKPFTPAELKVAVRQAVKHVLALREARELAEEKKRVRFQFISVLAHELKAPLGAIEGYLYLLQDGTALKNPETLSRVVERSLVRLQGMRKLIYDLLDLTRIESGEKKRELARVDVVAAAVTSRETMLPDAVARGITITLDSPEKLQMNGDRGEIEIVLNNLISNAVKYNRDNGTVTVKLSDSPDEVVMTVSDTGIGMSEEERERLFGEFVRIKNDRTRNILGSGLGLNIVKRIAALYDGRVSVESTPDVGSSFTVILKKKLEQLDGIKTD
jgi:signal transduction histidine kinase